MNKQRSSSGKFVKGPSIDRDRKEAAVLIMRLEKLAGSDPEIPILCMRVFWQKSLDIRTRFLAAIEAEHQADLAAEAKEAE